MIADSIQKQIGEAMKARDEVKLSTLKMLSSALSYDKIAKQHDLSADEELSVVRSEAKKRKDAIEVYTKVGQTERAEREKTELSVLEAYLPAQMSDEDLLKLVDEAIAETGASSPSDMGRAIGAVVAKAKGAADGSRISALVKEKLVK